MGPIFGFKAGAEYDQPIQFWLDYWKEKGLKFPTDLEPLMIKTLIAVESGFDEKAKTRSKRSTASGLMQLTNQSVRVLGGFPNQDGWIEIKDHVIRVRKQDKLDPIVNIALGIRLLSYKYTKIPKDAEKNLINTLKKYNNWGSEGTQYAKKVLALFEKSRKTK